MAKIKNVTGLTDKVKSDLISSLEKMLSSDMINGLNTAKYKIGDVLSYEKKKNSKSRRAYKLSNIRCDFQS